MPLLTELVSIADRAPRSGAMTLGAPFKARKDGNQTYIRRVSDD